jgi:hypothetical protein
MVEIKFVQCDSKALFARVICFDRIDVMRDGRLLRGLPIASAYFEDYQFGISALNKIAISGLSNPLASLETYFSSLQSHIVEDVPKPSFATTRYRDRKTAPRWTGKNLLGS